MDVSLPQRFTLCALCHSLYQVVGSNPTFCNIFLVCLVGFQIARSHAPEAPASGPHQHQKCQLLSLPAQRSSKSSSFWMAPDEKSLEAPSSGSPRSRVSRSSSFWTLANAKSPEAPASGCLQQRNLRKLQLLPEALFFCFSHIFIYFFL